MHDTVYLDGRFVAAAEAKVSAFDRGFLFGDAAYEVIPVYGGRVFRPAQHLARLGASLAELGIAPPHDEAGWNAIIARLLAQAGPGEQSLYIQVSRGADAGRDAALLVRDGELTEGSSSNVFAVLDGELRTAPADRRILRGITRDVVLELAAGCGIPVVERAPALGEVARAGEIFICSSTREIVPVTRLDGRAVGDGEPGPVTQRLIAAFDALKRDFVEAA